MRISKYSFPLLLIASGSLAVAQEIPTPDGFRSMGPVRSFDVTDNGERIAVIIHSAEVTPLPDKFEIILNWQGEIK